MVAIWGGLSYPFLHIRSPPLLDPNLFPYKTYPFYCTPPTPLMTPVVKKICRVLQWCVDTIEQSQRTLLRPRPGLRVNIEWVTTFHQWPVLGCPDDQGGDVGRNNGVSSQQVGGEKRFSLNFLECYDETSNYESIAKKPFFYHLLSFCSTSFHTYGFKDAV